jgi:lipoate---protein ligase
LPTVNRCNIQGEVHLSLTTDPYENLSFENYLLRHRWRDCYHLFLWQSSPAVVIGRFQNPLLECDLHYLQQNSTLLVRRQSGGGAVYHDEGNLNFSLIADNNIFDQKLNHQLIIDLLKQFQLVGEFKQHSSLLIDGKKVSGGAFKRSKDAAIYHGTLLISSNLDQLRRHLQGSTMVSYSQSIPSRPASVINLAQLNDQITIGRVVEGIESLFERRLLKLPNSSLKRNTISGQQILSYQGVREYRDMIKDHQWLYKSTPCFHYRHRDRTQEQEYDLVVKGGEVISSQLPILDNNGLPHSIVTGWNGCLFWDEFFFQESKI